MEVQPDEQTHSDVSSPAVTGSVEASLPLLEVQAQPEASPPPAATSPEAAIKGDPSVQDKKEAVKVPQSSARKESPLAPGERPVAAAKKFASSLSVSRQFLEKAASDANKGNAAKNTLNVPSRTLTPVASVPLAKSPVPAPAPTNPTSGPRLLSGKVNTQPAATLGSAASVTSGWARANDFSKQVNGQTPLPSQALVPEVSGFDRGRGRGGPMRGRGPGWGGSLDPRGGPSFNASDGDFPSVAEAAKSQQLKARAFAAALAAKDAKDKKTQQVASEAAAAYQQHMMEDLDAFRGVHLNHAHWDEMEDDDFGDVVDFGDGVRYEIPSELDPPAPPPAEAPPPPPTQATSPPIQLKHEFDRGAPSEPRQNAKALFNDRLGRLEPYSRAPAHSQPPPTSTNARANRRLPETATAASALAPQPAKLPATAPTSDLPKKPAGAPPANAWANKVVPSPHPVEQAPPLPATSQPTEAPSAAVAVPVTEPVKPEEDPRSDQFHKRAMQLGLEEARERRKREEEERLAQQERAKRKADEIGARLKAEAEAKEAARLAEIEAARSKKEEQERKAREAQEAKKREARQREIEAEQAKAKVKAQAQVAQAAVLATQPSLPPTTSSIVASQLPLLSIPEGAPPGTAAVGPRGHAERPSRGSGDMPNRPLNSASDRPPPPPSKAEEATSWRRTTPVQPSVPPALRHPHPPPTASVAEAPADGSWERQKARTVSFAQEANNEPPKVKLAADDASAKTQARGSSSIDDALSRLLGAMKESKVQREAEEQAKPVDRNAVSVYRIPYVDLSAQEVDMSITVGSRPPSPKPTSAWRVFPRIKLSEGGRAIEEVPPSKHRVPRTDRLQIVSWTMSFFDRLHSDFFREYQLFPSPLKTQLPVIQLPGQPKRPSVLISSEPEASETAHNLLEPFDGLFDAPVAAPAPNQSQQIAVVLPGRGSRKPRLLPTVKLPHGRSSSASAPSLLGSLHDYEVLPSPSAVTVEALDDSAETEFDYRTESAALSASALSPEAFEYGPRQVSAGWNAENADTLKVVKSVWDQPSPLDAQASLISSTAPNNSLRDLVDDFPGQLPTINDLRSDDGHNSDGPESTGNPALMGHAESSTAEGVSPASPSSAVAAAPTQHRLPPPFVPNNAPLPGVKGHQQWSHQFSSQGQFGGNTSNSQRAHSNHNASYSNAYYGQSNMPVTSMGAPGIWSPHPSQYGQRGNGAMPGAAPYVPTSPSSYHASPYQQMPMYAAQQPTRAPSSQGRPPQQPFYSNQAYDYSAMNAVPIQGYASYPAVPYPTQQGGRKGRW